MKRFVLFVAFAPFLPGCEWFSTPTTPTSGAALTRDDFRTGLDHLDQNFDKKIDEVGAEINEVRVAQEVQGNEIDQVRALMSAPRTEDDDDDEDGPTAEERRLRRKLIRVDDARLRAETAQERAEDDADEERRKLRRERRRHIHAEERQEDRLDRLEYGGGRVIVRPMVVDPTLTVEDAQRRFIRYRGGPPPF